MRVVHVSGRFSCGKAASTLRVTFINSTASGTIKAIQTVAVKRGKDVLLRLHKSGILNGMLLIPIQVHSLVDFQFLFLDCAPPSEAKAAQVSEKMEKDIMALDM